jgi:hypothetical protein
MYRVYYHVSCNVHIPSSYFGPLQHLPRCLESTKDATHANVYWFQLVTGPFFC